MKNSNTPCNTEKEVEEEKAPNKKVISENILFGTKTCPNCHMAKMLLDKAHIPYRFIDAEEDVEDTKYFEIKKVPTLLVPSKDDILVFENASNIKGYIESLTNLN